jgi:hypothetical protein
MGSLIDVILRHWVAGLLPLAPTLCACGSPGPAPPVFVTVPSPPVEVAAPEPPAGMRDERDERNGRVVWDEPVHPEGCFFFSGPGALGRDTKLGARARWKRDGSNVRLDLGRDAVFRGTLTQGRLALSRRADYRFQTRWSVTETIEGAVVGAQIQGDYHYEECESGAEQCPGRCTIAAHVVIALE